MVSVVCARGQVSDQARLSDVCVLVQMHILFRGCTEKGGAARVSPRLIIHIHINLHLYVLFKCRSCLV